MASLVPFLAGTCGPTRAERDLAASIGVGVDAVFRSSSIEARVTFTNPGPVAVKNPEIACYIGSALLGDTIHILENGRETALTRKVFTTVPAGGSTEETITFGGNPAMGGGARLMCRVTRVER